MRVALALLLLVSLALTPACRVRSTVDLLGPADLHYPQSPAVRLPAPPAAGTKPDSRPAYQATLRDLWDRLAAVLESGQVRRGPLHDSLLDLLGTIGGWLDRGFQPAPRALDQVRQRAQDIFDTLPTGSPAGPLHTQEE